VVRKAKHSTTDAPRTQRTQTENPLKNKSIANECFMNEFSKPTGINFSCVENVSAADLALALCKTASFLQADGPYILLHLYHDWWEHDGLHFYRRGIDFDELFKMICSPRALLEAMPGEDYVFVGVAPDDGKWYLRFYLFWDEEGLNLLGRFDLTVPYSLQSEYQKEVVQKLTFAMAETESAAYYKSIIV
jgi:hypothetical protein